MRTGREHPPSITLPGIDFPTDVGYRDGMPATETPTIKITRGNTPDTIGFFIITDGDHVAARSTFNEARALVDEARLVGSLLVADYSHEAEYEGCECELDYNCHLHRNRLYTAIERQNDAWASLDREWGF